MATHSIGQFQFVSMQVVPGLWTRSIQVIERPNVAGTELRVIARHGQTFTARTITDCADLWDCRLQITAYEQLVGDDAVMVTVNDVPLFMTEGNLFSVLSVVPVRAQRAAKIVNGLNGNSQAILYAAWQLKVINSEV